jgi:hypothetical protein
MKLLTLEFSLPSFYYVSSYFDTLAYEHNYGGCEIVRNSESFSLFPTAYVFRA